MNALWVLAHPDPHSLNSHLRNVGVRCLREAGWQVIESDLYAMQWNPILVDEGGADVEVEQQKLRDADLVVLQFPLWWFSVPAIMKGWIDRVLESGFAFDVIDPTTGRARKYGDGGLVGKRGFVITTADDRPGSFTPRGISGHVDDMLWPILHGTFFYTGMAALRPHLITKASATTSETIGDLERDLVDRLHTISTEEPIDYLPMNDDNYDHTIQLHPHVSADRVGNAAHRSTA